jgi:hypothetical protein
VTHLVALVGNGLGILFAWNLATASPSLRLALKR